MLFNGFLMTGGTRNSAVSTKKKRSSSFNLILFSHWPPTNQKNYFQDDLDILIHFGKVSLNSCQLLKVHCNIFYMGMVWV